MTEDFELFVDEATNKLGRVIAKKARSEEEYREGIQQAIVLLQDALEPLDEQLDLFI